MSEMDSVGYLRIPNIEDRAVVATILFKSGYRVSQVRQKRNGKTYEYFVKYERITPDIAEKVVTADES